MRDVPRLSPGYLDDSALAPLAERLNDPPPPWPEYPEALVVLRRSIAAEMALRESASPFLESDGPPSAPLRWPPVDPEALAAELGSVRARGGGRIPPPNEIRELWSHHKYSGMARDLRSARRIGLSLSHSYRAPDERELLPELVAILGTPPRERALRNAVTHMWRHVRSIARDEKLELDHSDIPGCIATIVDLVRRGRIAHGHERRLEYLIHTTALAELAIWGNGLAQPPKRRSDVAAEREVIRIARLGRAGQAEIDSVLAIARTTEDRHLFRLCLDCFAAVLEDAGPGAAERIVRLLAERLRDPAYRRIRPSILVTLIRIGTASWVALPEILAAFAERGPSSILVPSRAAAVHVSWWAATSDEPAAQRAGIEAFGKMRTTQGLLNLPGLRDEFPPDDPRRARVETILRQVEGRRAHHERHDHTGRKDAT